MKLQSTWSKSAQIWALLKQKKKILNLSVQFLLWLFWLESKESSRDLYTKSDFNTSPDSYIQNYESVWATSPPRGVSLSG